MSIAIATGKISFSTENNYEIEILNKETYGISRNDEEVLKMLFLQIIEFCVHKASSYVSLFLLRWKRISFYSGFFWWWLPPHKMRVSWFYYENYLILFILHCAEYLTILIPLRNTSSVKSAFIIWRKCFFFLSLCAIKTSS